MMTSPEIGAIGLLCFILGILFTYSLQFSLKQLSIRRARRRFLRYVQPTRFGNSPLPLSDREIETIGLSIYQVLSQQEKDCERRSLEELPRLGEKAPRCYEMTGRVLALLDAQSSCAWGCAGSDHVLERLVARSVNHARASLRLALMGFYDEALVLTRGVGEIANLLSLFEERRESFARWKSLDERARRREYSPVSVRTELKSIGTPIRVTTEAYAELSSKNVHVSPHTSPQTFDMIGVPKGGGYYQEAGLMICQNELAESLTFVAYAAARLSHIGQPLKMRMLRAGRELILNTGSLGVQNMQEMWAELMKKAFPDVTST